MRGPWQSAPNYDADTAPCQRCSKDVVLDHDPPCPHGYVACDTCDRADVCPACQTEAMSGDDWQDADPLYRPPVESREAYLTRVRNPHYDARTNTHRRQA